MQIEKAPISLDVKLLNEIFSDLTSPRSNKKFKFIERVDNHLGVSGNSYGEEGVQGEYDEYGMVYEILSRPGILVKFVYQTDSYGDNEQVTQIQFGRSENKTITVFEKL